MICFFISLSLNSSELEKSTPFKRKIHPDEIWLYRNPRTEDYVPISILWPVLLMIPVVIFLFNYLLSRDKNDISQALLALTLSLGLNGVITDVIKLVVGKRKNERIESGNFSKF